MVPGLKELLPEVYKHLKAAACRFYLTIQAVYVGCGDHLVCLDGRHGTGGG